MGLRKTTVRHGRWQGVLQATNAAVIPTLDKVIERQSSRPRNGEPQKQREILEFVEPQERLKRIDLIPLRRLDGHDHGHSERARGDSCQQAEQQKQATEELDARG